MNFKCEGEGFPVVLIHGFCESLDIWENFSSQLAKGFKVYRLDLPGFGHSPLDKEKTSLEEVAVQIHDWFEQEHIENPIVIGHSLGGYVTLALAELMGKDLKAIGLFHSTSFADDEAKKEVRNRAIEFVKKHGVKKFTDAFVPPLFHTTPENTFAEEIEMVQKIAENTSLNGFIAFTEAMRERKDRQEVLQNFQNPSLFIAGIHDQTITIENSRKQKNWVSDYKEVESAHMGMFEKPEKTAELLFQFCSKVNSLNF
jgi:pimeloyl-ACP methyl ester carboxylesterase